MGASISKNDTDAAVVDNGVEPTTSSCTSSQTDLTSINDLQPSSSSAPSTPSIESTVECHRLPPVESRETVRHQASFIRCWQPLDDAGDLYEAGPANQTTPSANTNGNSEEISPIRFSTPAEGLQETSFDDILAKQSASPTNTQGLSSSIEQSKKKCHLVVTSKAIEIALHRSDSSENNYLQQTQVQASSLRHPHDTLEEGAGWSFTKKEESKDNFKSTPYQSHHLSSASGTTFVNDEFPINHLEQKNFPLYQDEVFKANDQLNKDEIDQLLPRELSDHGEDENLVRNLTLMQPGNIVLFKAVRAFDQLPSELDHEEEDEELKEARQWMLRDQAEGAERSRMLREKALRRRSHQEPLTSPTLVEAELYCPRVSSPSLLKDDRTSDARLSHADIPDTADVRTDHPSDEQLLCEVNDDHELNRVHPPRSMSGLDLLAMKCADDLNISIPSRTETRDSRPKVSIPVKAGPDITLPPNFDALGEEEQSIVVNHETAKERKRDLDAIQNAMYWTGCLRCCGLFSDRDRNEVKELREFISLIVDQDESNRFTRRRVQEIRQNMKRRAGKFELPPSEDICGWQARLFPGRLDRLDAEIEKANEEVRQFGALRLDKSTKRKHSDRKPRKNKPRLTDPAERRQAKAAKADQLRERIKEQLKLFDDTEVPEILELPDQTAFIDHDHSNSEESEEEEGAEFVYGAGRNAASSSFTTPASVTNITNRQSQNISHDINEINRLENARQRSCQPQNPQDMGASASATAVSATSQAFDGELLKMMQAKKALQDLGIDSAVIKANIETRQTTDSSSETSETSDGDDTEDDQQVFQYTVLGNFAGLPNFKAGDNYVFKRTYNLLSAETRLKQVIQDVSTQFAPEGGYQGGNWSLNTSYRHGLIEQYFTIGEDVDVEARVWIEKKQVNIDKRLFRRAKAGKLGAQNIHYIVEWEKTVSFVVDGNDSDVEGDAVYSGTTTIDASSSPATASVIAVQDEDLDDDLDSLFGDDSTVAPQQKSDLAPASVPLGHLGTVTTTMPREEMKTYTTSVLANRHAKEHYMAWYARFFPGVANEGYRRVEDEAVEKELESMGTWGLWSREESFTRRAHRDEDGDEMMDGGDEERVQEKFKVWVRKVEVLGPRN
ncbi:hypothetical protein PV08_07645 [Exophiala spinifera]|uniref:Uncharacterized protein n=1 Tax=Exophiala spinifera TaxID=91928 RepID=A0A0D2B851_9EURO|nr:uncharacterized protein PV08_07645 [Exophiala spinifera]KIW14860.1 hypothetical protein PV08_07645 [Exophiala spinifera]